MPSIGTPAAARILRLVGLGVRSRGVVVGVEQVRQAAKRNRLALAIIARDASRHSSGKVVPLLNARRIRFVVEFSSVELGIAVGREQAAAVGIVDSELARGMRDLLVPSSLGAPQEDV